MPPSIEGLDEIGLRFGTDKASFHHDYLQFYERYMKDSRQKNIKLLEVGVLNGASLKTWASYFENGAIIGADITPETRIFRNDRIEIEIFDQSNVQELVDVAVKHGPFDFIIEDGSHIWDHQILTLQTLFPFLRNDGIYIVEDLQTNYGPMTETYRGVASYSCMDYLKRAVDLRVADENIAIEQEADAFLRTYSRSMNFHFHRRVCLIEKKYAPIPRCGSDAGEPLLDCDVSAKENAVSILAHIGLIGDLLSETGSIRSYSTGNIQGFSVSVPARLSDAIRYKVRFSDGTWSPWSKPDEFAGTRGVAQDLTGFHVELLEPVKDHVELTCVGLFRGQADLVVTREGSCVPFTGFLPLLGMQVVLRPSD